MSTAADLFALQELDLARDRVLARLQEIEAALSETTELAAAKEDLDDKSATAESLRRRLAELEMDVEEVSGKASEVEAKLYSGKVASPKELSDLAADLKMIRALKSKREDVLLAHLEEVESADAARAASASAYAAIAAEWKEHHEDLLREEELLRPEAANLAARIDTAKAGIDGRAFSLYKLLRDHKGGLAAARVERGMCQGCRITLPAAILQRARTSSSFVQCVSCERILILD